MRTSQNQSLTIIHSDPHYVVIEKPGGLLSVPGRGPDKQDCIVNRVKQQFPDCIEQPAVHRLDMDTSGLMVLAFTKQSHRNLSIQFAKQLVKKRYIALLEGKIQKTPGKIELPFRLDIDNRPHQIYDPELGKIGTTVWRVLQIEGNNTRMEFSPLTGRTHQLRVHSAHKLGLGCPIVGDRLYGNGSTEETLKLHASYLAFKHPASGKDLEFTSKIPF